MDDVMQIFDDFLREQVTVHIYSLPNFILETFLAATLCVVYVLLIQEVQKIETDTLHFKPNSLAFKVTGKSSEESISTSITYCQREICLNVDGKATADDSEDGAESAIFPQHLGDRRGYLGAVLALSPEEFVRFDKQRKLRTGELKEAYKSLTTLFKDALSQKYSEKTFKHFVDLARENVELAKMAVKRNGAYQPAAITNSLLELLENISDDNYTDGPVTFKGDITSFTMDAGNLGSELDKLKNKQREIKDDAMPLVELKRTLFFDDL